MLHGEASRQAFVRHEALPLQYEGRRSAIAVQKLGTYLGAEIGGLDLSQELSDAQVADIDDAWVVHGVLVIRQIGLCKNYSKV